MTHLELIAWILTIFVGQFLALILWKGIKYLWKKAQHDHATKHAREWYKSIATAARRKDHKDR